MLRCGRFEIHSIVTGFIRLDGGAMFGVVPKALWARNQDVDDQNRILLATRTLLAIDPVRDQIILADTGTGTKWGAKGAERYGVDSRPHAIAEKLASLGRREADVTDVIVTHLHFDHNGGLTDWTDDSRQTTRLRYPQARHWIHRDHWAHALHPTLKDRASFFREDFEALTEAEVLRWVEGPCPKAPFEGMEWFLTHGHTPAQLTPFFRGPEGSLLMTGDAIPTSAHLPLPWVMAYDLHPLTTIEEKERILKLSREENVALAFPHDPRVAAVELEPRSDKPVIAHALDL